MTAFNYHRIQIRLSYRCNVQLIINAIMSEGVIVINYGIETNIYIYDPRYKYKGVSLAASKHFYPIKTIKEFIDSIIYTNLMHLIGTLLIN